MGFNSVFKGLMIFEVRVINNGPKDQTLRWFPRFQVASTCFSCSPPDLNILVTNFI